MEDNIQYQQNLVAYLSDGKVAYLAQTGTMEELAQNIYNDFVAKYYPDLAKKLAYKGVLKALKSSLKVGGGNIYQTMTNFRQEMIKTNKNDTILKTVLGVSLFAGTVYLIKKNRK